MSASPFPLPLETGLAHRGADPAAFFPPPGSLEALGGPEGVARLVDFFYDRIDADPVLRPAFPRDLTSERAKGRRFFAAWLDGTSAYFGQEWPPSLTAAHGGIVISRGMAGRWVGHFLDACAEAAGASAAARVKPAVGRLAMALVNRADEPASGERLRCSTHNADTALLRLVGHDDAEGVAQAVADQPDVLSRQGARLLLIAAVRGKGRAVEALLRAGVEPNAVALLSGTEASAQGLPMLPIAALCGALAKGRDAVVETLAAHGARYDIFTAAFVGDTGGLEALLDAAPELVDACDPAGDVGQITPLTHAVLGGQDAAARCLLRRGARLDGADRVRLLRAAANRGDAALTDLLLAHGADPKRLGAGVWVLHPALADTLRARGADVNAKPGAWIGLSCTGNSGHRENVALVRALLRCGADITARYRGGTALHCAARAGFAQVVEVLLAHGGDVGARDDRGRTPLDALESAGKSVDREPVRRLLTAHGPGVSSTAEIP